MTRFAPHYETLPSAQRCLLPELVELPRHFVLYGGTALALRLGHRASVDFDFFTSEPFVPLELLSNLRVLAGAKVLQNVGQTLTVMVERDDGVKLSFVGALPLKRVGEP